MSRRKGELSSYQLDQRWPLQVTIRADLCTVLQHTRIRAFCAGLSLAPLGHTYVEDGAYWTVFCFAVLDHAEAFAAEFGGRMLAPEDRPRWPGRRAGKRGGR